MQLCILQKHDGFPVTDLARNDSTHGVVQGQFKSFDVFAFCSDTAASALLCVQPIFNRLLEVLH